MCEGECYRECCVCVTGKVMLHRLTRLGIKCVFVTLNLASFYIRKVSYVCSAAVLQHCLCHLTHHHIA